MAKQRGGDKKYPTCCFCCHVRLGALLIGFLYLIWQLGAFGFLGYLMVNLDKIPSSTEININYSEENGEASVYFENYDQQHEVSANFCVMLVMTFCYFAITCMHIYGVLKHQSCYVLPFFCIQLFEFCIACLTVIRVVSYAEDDPYYTFVQDTCVKMFDKYGIDIGDRWWILFTVFSLMLVLSIKAYFISVVWSCYKYIVERNNACQATSEQDTEALLPPPPPAYHLISKVPMDQPQPPPYEANATN